jgi:hypothetical protein
LCQSAEARTVVATTPPAEVTPILPNPLQTPYRPDDEPVDTRRPLAPPPVVITVTHGVDPNVRRDPARLNDASPFFATTSQAPRTP